MQLGHQGLGAGEHRAARFKAFLSVSRECALQPHVRRLMAKSAGLQDVATRLARVIIEVGSDLLPRQSVDGGDGRSRVHVDVYDTRYG